MTKWFFILALTGISVFICSCTFIHCSDAENATIVFNADQATRLVSDSDVTLYKLNTQQDATAYVTRCTAEVRSGKFTTITHFAADASIVLVEIADYPYTHGRRIKKRQFLDQFTGWNTESRIDAMTTATQSSKATVEAVRKSKQFLQSYLASSSLHRKQNKHVVASFITAHQKFHPPE